ncbi:NAC domain-containing protein 58-like [Oryza sativa Japonica Group]|uniref:Os11g0512000 protein n=3 Tax=Oryza TaxID=4527 RepID=A0A8J8YRB3_ORYSJ|nr:NAC transcription factor 25 [Oryza sativa Japonica Group]ABA93863.1 No apical meristem protein, expressed [Oryza sativa Japonica Group]EAZ18487.1 hypothetical protein OsJ_34013 [Oryza sativa Japonica Group]KAF2910974.1 hypothetical protein DAI22_11g143100 [Oryza sativa Japonica Group]BAF28319.1 Os11g0512000 [Oryza sativa Japonica Group]BAG98033.1 unnamed protein product [Oryza sativa Japonica Group]|eukprot:NP_001067956.1 Os11g0512000 [Oryza sativa Japonica Group]
MANTGLSIPMVNGATIHLLPGFRFRPTDDELVIKYLYPRAFHVPLPCAIITDVDIHHHNPWDIVPVAEREKGKHFFTRKEVKYPGSRRSNRVAGNGFWRAAGSEVPIYYKPEGAANDMLVGMRRTLVFHYGKSRSAERTEWAMHEFQLAGAGLLPHPMMRHATSNGSEPPCGCLEATIAKKSDGLSATLRAKRDSAPLMRIMVEPDSSWVICCIYKKRQRAPPVVIPPVIGDVGEAIIPHAIGDAREGQLHFIDFLGQPARNDPSSPHSCTIDPSSLEEGSDESAGDGEDKDGDGMNEAN